MGFWEIKNVENEKMKKKKEMEGRKWEGRATVCGERRGSREWENEEKKWGRVVCVGSGRGVWVMGEEEEEGEWGRKKVEGLRPCVGARRRQDGE